jgi:hypothetical protein
MPYAKGLFKLSLGASVAGATVLKADVFTFTGNVNSGWRVNGNWDEPNWPEDGDTAIIPANKTVCVGCDDSENHSECTDIQVALTGVVEIEGAEDNYSLTLHENSTVDGEIIFTGSGMDTSPKLIIAESLTITSSGTSVARIRGGIDHDGLSYGEILDVDGATLTIDSTVTVQGAITVRAPIVNEGVFLVNHAADTMTLSDDAKDGASTGKWKVTAGDLIVWSNVTVTGSAKWILKGDPGVSSITIQTGADVDSLSGDLDQTGGWFYIGSDFCTTGDITLKSVEVGEDAKLQVKFGKEATFNAASCP